MPHGRVARRYNAYDGQPIGRLRAFATNSDRHHMGSEIITPILSNIMYHFSKIIYAAEDNFKINVIDRKYISL